MRLSELSNKTGLVPDPEIAGLTQDSCQVQKGWLFAALPGVKVQGRDYIEDAIRRGAIAVLAEPGTPVPDDVILIESKEPRRDFARMAARFYKDQPDMIAVVTGTNGKTSTAYFTQQLWQYLGLKAASLGTLGVCGTDVDYSGSLTTPDPVTLHKTLADFVKKDISCLAMEASSHGLQQYRLDGVRAGVAGFTNLSRDHLDYHENMESYLQAKARLFLDILLPDGVAVLNADVPEFQILSDICSERQIKVLGYGQRGKEIRLIETDPLPQGQGVVFDVYGQRYALTLPLVGSFQIMNALCALGLVMAHYEDVDKVVTAMESLQGAPGRLQPVEGHPAGAAIYVDYAHTPDALDNVLKSLRPHTQGRLVCLIGCGGDRDPGKRSMMGKVADEMADIAIITDDNPRSEDPADIRTEMMVDTKQAIEIDGRREAIRQAVKKLEKDDVLVIAGKGHEQGQIIGDRVEPFDDVDETKKAIALLQEGRAA